jgi:ABC-type Zn2+ transport system substrate-binding protein/surface adhesin
LCYYKKNEFDENSIEEIYSYSEELDKISINYKLWKNQNNSKIENCKGLIDSWKISQKTKENAKIELKNFENKIDEFENNINNILNKIKDILLYYFFLVLFISNFIFY